MQQISTIILNKLGWKVKNKIDKLPSKCVLCVAPHTSNWDLLLGKLIYSSLGQQAYFLIKNTWFFFPMNLFFKSIGGIPVDRSQKTSLTEQMVKEFHVRERFQLAITPEGTRKFNSEWKKGFYFIALEAKVPIVIVIFDYKSKKVTFETLFIPTGDSDKDIQQIRSYYVNATGKHSQNFSVQER